MKQLDRWILKRELQGLMGVAIGMTDENVSQKTEDLITALEKLHRKLISKDDEQLWKNPTPTIQKEV